MTSTSAAKVERKTYIGKRKQQNLTERSGIFYDDSTSISARDCRGYPHTKCLQGGLARGNEAVPVSFANEYAPARVLGGGPCVNPYTCEPWHLAQFGEVSSELRRFSPEYGIFSCGYGGVAYNLVPDIPNGSASVLQGITEVAAVNVQLSLHVVTGRLFA